MSVSSSSLSILRSCIVAFILNRLLFRHDERLCRQFPVIQSGTLVLGHRLVVATELDGALRAADLVGIPWYSLRSAKTSCMPSLRRTSLSRKQDYRARGVRHGETVRREGLVGAGGCMPVPRSW